MKPLNGFDKATLKSARNSLVKLIEFNSKDVWMEEFCESLKKMVVKINEYLNY